MSRRLDKFSLDWDDSALIKAYNKGMSLRVEDLQKKEKKHFEEEEQEKEEWQVGDYCQALYPEDNLMYEAKIKSIASDGTCIVDFLGYDDELEVDLETLAESGGKRSRRKQIRKATKPQNPNRHIVSPDESACGDDSRNNVHSPIYSSKKKHQNNHGNQVLNHSVDYTAAESTFHATYPTPGQYTSAPPTSMPFPILPPVPQIPDSSQDLNAMLIAWYMAGYYTAIHQVQKNPRCCHASQNCCHR